MVAGLVLLAVAVLVVVVVLLVRRHQRRDGSVFGSLPDARPGAGTAASRLTPSGHPEDPLAGVINPERRPEVHRLAEGLRQAMADGELTDDEIQRLLPGAQVVRDGDEIRVEHVSTTHSVEVDGVHYDNIDDIPDPALRDTIRKTLGQ